MEIFQEYLTHVEDPSHRARMEEVLGWVAEKYPALSPRIAWNQPMFTDHGTFIVGFSASKRHMAVAPERAGIMRFEAEMDKAGLDHTKELARFAWDNPVDFGLLGRMIEFNMLDKASCQTFWRR